MMRRVFRFSYNFYNFSRWLVTLFGFHFPGATLRASRRRRGVSFIERFDIGRTHFQTPFDFLSIDKLHDKWKHLWQSRQDTTNGSFSDELQSTQTRQSEQNHLLPLSTKLTRLISTLDLMAALAQDEWRWLLRQLQQAANGSARFWGFFSSVPRHCEHTGVWRFVSSWFVST